MIDFGDILEKRVTFCNRCKGNYLEGHGTCEFCGAEVCPDQIPRVTRNIYCPDCLKRMAHPHVNEKNVSLMKTRISLTKSEVRKLDQALIYMMSDLSREGLQRKHSLPPHDYDKEPYFKFMIEFKIMIHSWLYGN